MTREVHIAGIVPEPEETWMWTDLDIAQVLTDFVPLSRLMAEQITGLRQWAKGRARPATTPPTETKLRKLAVE